MPPKKTTAVKTPAAKKKKQTTAAPIKNAGKTKSVPTSNMQENTGAISALDIAEKILANDLLFNEDFVQQQKKNLAALQETEKTSSKFHEMPEENLKVAVVGAFSCGKSAFINSILEDSVAPSEITPLTHGVTSFIYGEKEIYKADDNLINREEYQAKVQGKDEKVKHFIIEYPCARLKEFEFIDSPGFASVSNNENKLAQEDTALSEEAVHRADVVFFLNNVTEGVIQGDSLKRLHAIVKDEKAGNPHRRVYVVLTWADQKPPKARNTIRDSIIQLCEDEKLSIDGVMLYSSVPEKAKKSDQDFFHAAKEQLFLILTKLRQEGQELKKFRSELKQHADSLKKKTILNSFINACKLHLNYQPSVLKYQQEKKFDKDWEKFIAQLVEKAAEFTCSKIDGKLFSFSLLSSEKLTDHTFSDYQLKIHYDRLDLSEDDMAELAGIFDFENAEGLTIPEDDESISSFILSDDDSDSLNVKQVFNKICREILVLNFKPEFFATESQADEKSFEMLSEISGAFKKSAPDIWKEYLTIIFKDAVREATLTPEIKKMEKQLRNVKKLLSELSSGQKTSKKLNLNVTESDMDIYEALGL